VKKIAKPKVDIQAATRRAAEIAAKVQTIPAAEAKDIVFTTRKRNSSPWRDVFFMVEDLHKGKALKIPGVMTVPIGLKKAAKDAGAVLEFALNGDGLLVRIREYIRQE